MMCFCDGGRIGPCHESCEWNLRTRRERENINIYAISERVSPRIMTKDVDWRSQTTQSTGRLWDRPLRIEHVGAVYHVMAHEK